MNTITFGRLGQFHPTTVMACISAALCCLVVWHTANFYLISLLFSGRDVVRELMWGRDWLIFPPWHPPLPDWLAYTSFVTRGNMGGRL